MNCRGRFRVFILFSSAIVFVGSQFITFAENSNSFFQFVTDQRERHYTQVPHEVLAFYYGWYDPSRKSWGEVDTNQHELSKTARYPVKGPYDSHDPAIIDWQIDHAKAHGISGFIVSWWGTAAWDSWHDQSLELLMEHAAKKNFKISIYWEQAPGEGEDQVGRAIGELSYVLKKYGKSPVFLKLDGKPVIFAYNRVVMFQVPAWSWPTIIEGVRARAGDFALIGDGQKSGHAYLFDGIHSYGLYGLPPEFEKNLTADKLGEFRAWVAHFYADGVKIARELNRISCLVVVPGSDARKVYKFDYQTARLQGQTYQTLWEEAIKAKPDWIIITSWNEWPEGSEIEPSLEFGDKYLQITAEYAEHFLKSPPIEAPPPKPLPRLAPGTTRDLNTLLSHRKIGVLEQTETDDTEFWPAYCGATLQRLTWKDLIDPKIFNASNFPVFIHIANEHYNSSVKVTDDVTRALVRYLHEGGFLVSFPSSEPWPFHYDDSRKGIPFVITDKLGMGVDNGFDVPPSGVELTFYAKTNVLFGLSATAPFPKTGLARFRSTNRARIPATDIYVPLVQLKDSTGKIQGDAVTYIEHRTGLLAPGKSLYVWTRVPEAFEPDVFLPSLFEFISTRL
jgi:glycoprotein endo-alpha-1,2-mannosidase